MSAASETIATTVDATRYREKIRAELVAIVCARLGVIVLIESFVSTSIIVSVLWEVATSIHMAMWLGIHFALVLSHGYVYLRFRIGQTDRGRLHLYLSISMLLLGIYWAVLLSHMFVVTFDYAFHFYLFLFMGALGVLGVAMLSEDLFSLVGFVAPPFLALMAVSIATGKLVYLELAGIGLLTAIAVVLFARIKNRDAVESFALRFAITDLANELREQRDAAQRANISKSKFLAAASHDLRQPLHALTLLTTALHDSNIDAGARRIVSDMSGAIDSLEKMFGALLDISKLDAGVLLPEPRHFDVGVLLRRVADEFALPARAKGLRLRCEPGVVYAHTDPLLLERIVRNYVANAVRYTHAGAITLDCRKTDRGVSIDVTDTGIGITGEQQAEIFDEFYQVDNPERDRSKGLGLGLAIVRRIAELLCLDYGVESSLGQGSRFYVVTPSGDAAHVAAPIDNQIVQRQSLAGLRVLVIDDDIAVRESMHTLLSTWSCDVAVAGDAEQAVRTARERFAQPDALVVDYRLREQRTGVEGIALIRAEFKVEVPALIVSGDTAPERLREVAASGHTLIHKPAQPAALRSFLLSALRAKNSAQ